MWSHKEVNKWVKSVDGFGEVLLSLIHKSSVPGRAPEYACMRYKDSLSMGRGVFIIDGSLAFSPPDTKSLWARDASLGVVRFPDVVTSALGVLYFSVIRPIYDYFVAHVIRPQAAPSRLADNLCYAFVRSGKPLSDSQVRAIICHRFQAVLHRQVRFADYRQALEYVISVKVGIKLPSQAARDEEAEGDGGDLLSTLRMSFMHSVSTAIVRYGQSQMSLPHVAEDTQTRYFVGSVFFHVLVLGVDNGAWPAVTQALQQSPTPQGQAFCQVSACAAQPAPSPSSTSAAHPSQVRGIGLKVVVMIIYQCSIGA